VTATDLLNETGTVNATFFHDDPPVITITSPTDWSVARPNVHAVATCTDDALGVGCLSFKASVGALQASGSSAIDTTLDLTGYDGQAIDLTLTASDSNGATTQVIRHLFVDTSAHLFAQESVAGRVIDFDAARILLATSEREVWIRDRRTSSDVTILSAGTEPAGGWLTPRGALIARDWSSPNVSGDYNLIESADGQSSTLATVPAFPIVGGHFVSWVVPTQGGGAVILRDLLAETTTTVVAAVGPDDAGAGTGGFPLDIGPEGDLLYVQQTGSAYSLFRYSNASSTKVTTDLFDPAPKAKTDSTSVAYSQASPPTTVRVSSPNGTSDIVNVALSSASDLAIASGWVGFMRKSVTSGVRQVWVRSPSGVESQISLFGTDSILEFLSGIGEVMFQNGGRRYLGSPSSIPVDVSSALGRAVHECGAWYIIMGNTVFQVIGVGTDGGTGCPIAEAEGGPSDSGVDKSDASVADAQLPNEADLDGGTVDSSILPSDSSQTTASDSSPQDATVSNDSNRANDSNRTGGGDSSTNEIPDSTTLVDASVISADGSAVAGPPSAQGCSCGLSTSTRSPSISCFFCVAALGLASRWRSRRAA
jgi:hypothetical protein